MSVSTSTPHWNSLKRNINFNPQMQNDHSFFSNVLQSLQPIASVNGDASYRHHSNATTMKSAGDTSFVSCPSQNISRIDLQQAVSLLSVCHFNKTDLAELLMTQYQQSHLPLDEFMTRCSLFHELNTLNKHHSNKSSDVADMLHSYMKIYSSYIASPLQCIQQSAFTPFNDHIDITLRYLLRINQCLDEYMQSVPALFDVYFVPPSAPKDLDFVDIEGMVESAPNARCRRQSMGGLDDIYSLFLSEAAQKMLSNQSNTKRYVLVIVRENEYNTNGDVLYLVEQKLNYDLNSDVFANNEILWNILSKKDVLCSKYQRISVDDPNYRMFQISYHLHAVDACKMYQYYNGFGSRITKKEIMNEWHLLFRNGKNKISNSVKRELLDQKQGKRDFLQHDLQYKQGEYFFGLRYNYTRAQNTKRRILHFPKNVLKHNVPQIREFDDPQKQLYYYLSWTCKMQVIDGEFMEYTLNSAHGPQYIAIFNAELHEKHSNDALYVIATLNDANGSSRKQPTWVMSGMMTAHQIHYEFGIDFQDLPIGSRYIHHQFEPAINQQNIGLHSNFIPVSNWRRVDQIHSQKYEDGRLTFKGYDLNAAIQESVQRVRNNKDPLSLIPILTVDLEQQQIKCESLLPIKIPNRSSYVSVSYRVNHKNKNVVTGLYIDVHDMIKKAALVDAHAYETYVWLNGDTIMDNVPAKQLDLQNVDSMLSVQSVPSVQSAIPLRNNDSGDSLLSLNLECPLLPNTQPTNYVQTLTDQLRDAFGREKILLAWLTQKDEEINKMRQKIPQQMPPMQQKMHPQMHITQNISQQMNQIPVPNIMTPNVMTPNVMTPNIITPIRIPSPNLSAANINTPNQTVNNINNLYFNQNYRIQPIQHYSPPVFPCLAGNNGVTLPQTPESNMVFALSQIQNSNLNQIKQ